MLQIRRLLLAALACAALYAPVRAYYIMDTPLEEFSQAVAFSPSLMPAAYGEVVTEYRKGNYQLCILKLNTLIGLELPDGRLDPYLLMAGECYHQLRLDKFASTLFQQLIREYPESPLFRYAAYRLQEDAYERGDSVTARYFFGLIQGRFGADSVGAASAFVEAKRLYKAGLIPEADKLLAGVPKTSDLFHPAIFIRSLCSISRNDIERGMLQLDLVIQGASDRLLRDEAVLVYAELYIKLNRDAKALELLKTMSPDSPKYPRALLIAIQCHLKMKDLSSVIGQGEKLLKLPDVTYLFETAMVLEQAYLERHENAKIDSLRNHVELTVRRKKLVYDIYRELDVLSEMEVGLSYEYLTVSDRLGTLSGKRMADAVFTEMSGEIAGLKERSLALLREWDKENTATGRSGFSDIRFLDHLNMQIDRLNLRAESLSAEASLVAAKRDTSLGGAEAAILAQRTAVLDSIQRVKEIRQDVQTYCLGENVVLRETEDLQAKFVDWSLNRLEGMKKRLRDVYRDLSRIEKESKVREVKAPEEKKEAPANQDIIP